ncbi:hypothetical protein LguiA_008893 [Lonicera macranthoides]
MSQLGLDLPELELENNDTKLINNEQNKSMNQVDPNFIQAVEHRSKLTVIEVQGIPLIDLSTSNMDGLVT